MTLRRASSVRFGSFFPFTLELAPRRGRVAQGAARDWQMAALAMRNGGDGLLLNFDQSQNSRQLHNRERDPAVTKVTSSMWAFRYLRVGSFQEGAEGAERPKSGSKKRRFYLGF